MSAIAAAVIFVWLGMVAAISFLEAPLKFNAPGITIQLGLGIGRLVFRALNAVEIVLAAVVLATVLPGGADRPGAVPLAAIGVAVVVLAVQTLAVRPRLRRRADAVLAATAEPAGGMIERSHAHYVYAALEVVKVIALLTAGVGLQIAIAAG
ncbi:hypothetical protein KIH27_10000 [Mycobacterium sp. M1]|uniref:Transmembrane protein n=1 Tax=Mycolicibacter acidiphilus TaxID=2835306 RepID=A0ABS5RK93_9MYCO|nr:hypothetical protein [Mycolicibacter acidiphilus]MBS9533916.1 hypothetical protein [Mycolicibacter acidiphilus]